MIKIFISSAIRKLGYLAAGALVAFAVGYCSDVKANYTPNFWYESAFTTQFGQTVGSKKFATFQSALDSQLYYLNNSANISAASKPWTITSIAYPNVNYKPINSANPTNYYITLYYQCGTNTPVNANGFLPSNYTNVCTGSCPAGTTLNATTGQCDDICAPLKGTTTYFSHTSGDLKIYCMTGCQVDADFAACGTLATSGQCSLAGIHTGISCTAPIPTTVPPSPEFDCIKEGKTYGTVNGTVVCLEKGTAGSAPVTEATKAKTVYETAAPTAVNPTPSPVPAKLGGSVSLTINPSLAGQDPTVSKTTTGADGSVKTETQDKGGFCEENPNSKICNDEGEDSSFGGGCGGFTCDGDAIQCAIAKEQHNRNCALFVTETELSNTGNAATQNGELGEGTNPSRSENREIIDLPTSLDDSDRGFNGTLQDVTVSLPGSSVTLPFSELTTILTFMGYIVMGFAYYGAYKIVGGVK